MRRPSPAVVLVFAVLGISFAAPLIRLSDAHPVAIAVWRLVFSLVAVGGILLATGQWREWRSLAPRDVALAAGAGVMLAIHFWTFNASLALTTIAASVVLVNLQPAFVALLSAVVLHEAPSRRQWLGIAVALVGALVVTSDALRSEGFGAGRSALAGDALAVAGAITAALYYSAGRRLRAGLGLWGYVGLVYGACLVSLLVIASVAHVPLWPQPPREMWIFAGLAAGPMLLGHTGMNYALRYLPAYVVNLTVLGEPVGATFLGAVLPGIAEIPPLMAIAGGGIILAGILLTALPQRTERQRRA